MLCERGIRTYEEYVRNTLALAAVPELQRVAICRWWSIRAQGTGKSHLVEQHVPRRGRRGRGWVDHRSSQRSRACHDGWRTIDHACGIQQMMHNITRIAAAVDREV